MNYTLINLILITIGAIAFLFTMVLNDIPFGWMMAVGTSWVLGTVLVINCYAPMFGEE